MEKTISNAAVQKGWFCCPGRAFCHVPAATATVQPGPGHHLVLPKHCAPCTAAAGLPARPGRYGLGLTTAPKEEQRKTISFVTDLCQLEMLFSSVIVPPPSWPNPSGYLTSTAQLRHPHSALQCHSCCPSLGNRWAHCPEHSDTSPNIGKCRKAPPTAAGTWS